MARTAHEVRRHRQEAKKGRGPEVLWLNAGDTAKVRCPNVAANLDVSHLPSLSNIKKSVVITKGGQKIGIVGHVTVETRFVSQPGPVSFYDELASVKQESERLAGEGVGIIIVLGHSGIKMDQRMAAEVPQADVVVGAHSHTFLWNGYPPSIETPEGPYPVVVQQASGKKVPVVQAYAYTKYLGKLYLKFDDKGELTNFYGQPQLMEASIPQDEDILNLLAIYQPEVDKMNTKVVGRALGDLEGAVMNGGGIRNTISPLQNGEVTRGDLLGALPFGNSIVSKSLTGEDIVKTLEIGLRSYSDDFGGEFLQVSGIKVVYDLSKPVYSRVKSVEVKVGDDYEDLIPTEKYTVIAPSFLALDGGDGHVILTKHGTHKTTEVLGDIDLIVWYVTTFWNCQHYLLTIISMTT
nr:unnamed protein product [Callosobruchus analis]